MQGADSVGMSGTSAQEQPRAIKPPGFAVPGPKAPDLVEDAAGGGRVEWYQQADSIVARVFLPPALVGTGTVAVQLETDAALRTVTARTPFADVELVLPQAIAGSSAGLKGDHLQVVLRKADGPQWMEFGRCRVMPRQSAVTGAPAACAWMRSRTLTTRLQCGQRV